MKERPILFSGPMVRAILAGHKHQTRRFMKPQPSSEFYPEKNGMASWYAPTMIDKRTGEAYPGEDVFGVADENEGYISRYGHPGDHLWVRETFYDSSKDSKRCPTTYRATFPKEDDHHNRYDRGFKWRPSIFMRRHQSRLTLEITAIRVERLQDISEEDAQAEGIHRIAHGREGHYYHAFETEPNPDNWTTAARAYRHLWETIHGKIGEISWDKNPWVWVIEFRKL